LKSRAQAKSLINLAIDYMLVKPIKHFRYLRR